MTGGGGVKNTNKIFCVLRLVNDCSVTASITNSRFRLLVPISEESTKAALIPSIAN